VPGSPANIDHIVIGPAGVFVVDAKNHAGPIEIRDRGGFLHSDVRLMINRRDRSKMADRVLWQAEVVASALEEAHVDEAPVAMPVLCFLNVEWPLFRPPREFRGVRLESHRSIRRLVTQPTRITEAQADLLVAVLAGHLGER
jgi:hypothetical protein